MMFSTLTQVVKPFVHDAGFSGVNCLDLVSAQRPSWQCVVVEMPAIKTLEAHFSTTSQQPLCCCSVWAHSFYPFIVHPEWRSTNSQSTAHADMWWNVTGHICWVQKGKKGQETKVKSPIDNFPTRANVKTWTNRPRFTKTNMLSVYLTWKKLF